MKSIAVCATALLAAALALSPAGAGESESHAHIGHVMTGWQDTPDQKGLLPTGQAEAAIARQHIGFALTDPADLGSIQAHTSHVLHAVNPEAEGAGPGLGYGVRSAAAGVEAHINFAAASDDASDNVKLHAQHVGASALNVVEWSDEIALLAAMVKSATSAEDAAAAARKIEALFDCIIDGCDADGDGTVSWGPGEGGLAQAAAHMGYMMDGEGL